MKRIALIAATSMALFACKKGEDPSTKTNTFAAKVNGTEWTANETTWSKVNSLLQVEGRKGNTYIRFFIPIIRGQRLICSAHHYTQPPTMRAIPRLQQKMAT